MQQQQIDDLKVWFGKYVAEFYDNDEFFNANIKLKEDHSLRVCDEMLYLTDALDIEENQTRIAEVIALLHDIGRFEQFKKYRTYHDPRSINHCLLGLEVIKTTAILDETEKAERKLIELAIELHGTKQLPADLDNQQKLHCQLIRDADKLDIYYVVTEGYEAYEKDPESFKLEMELPYDGGYSIETVEDILNGRRIAYEKLETWDDMKLLQLGWVYDVNFTATLQRIKQRRFLEKILTFLPNDGNIEKVAKKITQYLQQTLAKER